MEHLTLVRENILDLIVFGDILSPRSNNCIKRALHLSESLWALFQIENYVIRCKGNSIQRIALCASSLFHLYVL